MTLDELATPLVSRRWITARNNKRRLIHVPNQAMRELHAHVIRQTRQQLGEMPAAYGGIRGGSAVRHALQHQGHRHVYKLDLYEGYPSVRTEWITPLLATVKSELWMDAASVETFVQRHLIRPEGRGLMTGTPASPDLFNRVAASRLDEALIELAEKYGLTYTRYMDDLVFSSWNRIGARKREKIRAVIRNSGFRLNFRKTEYRDVRVQPVMITGLRLGTGPSGKWPITTSVFVPRRWLTRLEGVLYCFARGDDIEPGYIEGLMGVLRDVSNQCGGFIHRHQARVWGAYLAIRPQIRPNSELTPLERIWALSYQKYLHFEPGGQLRDRPLPAFEGYVSPFPERTFESVS